MRRGLSSLIRILVGYGVISIREEKTKLMDLALGRITGMITGKLMYNCRQYESSKQFGRIS